MENLVKDFKFQNKEENSDLLNIIKSIKSKFQKKKETRKDLIKLKGKILIEKQIIEEYKRKIEENSDYYKDQIKEYEENRDNKEEYIKIFEKKLKEVEIYVQKHIKTNPKFEIYKDFKMNEFIDENTELIKRRDVISNEMRQAREKKIMIEMENENFRNEMNFSFNNNEIEVEDSYKIEESENKDKKKTRDNCISIYNSEICNIGPELPIENKNIKNKKDNNKLNEESKQRLKKMYDKYVNQVRGIDLRIKLLKNYFNEMSDNLKYFNISKCKINFKLIANIFN